jgi:hypothetical protein
MILNYPIRMKFNYPKLDNRYSLKLFRYVDKTTQTLASKGKPLVYPGFRWSEVAGVNRSESNDYFL